MELEITFANPAQRSFYYSNARNQCFSGGFNNGKTYAGCLKAFTLLSTFPKYRMCIARQTFADLKITTIQTFFKICPRELVARYNEQDGFLELLNGSVVYFKHLDKVDESTLRGLEINSALVDQAEEIDEKVYDILDARIGRWDDAIVPQGLLDKYPQWPRSRKGKTLVPSYMMLLVNPDTQYHFIYRKFHPDSLERKQQYFFIEGEWDPSLGSEETYNEALLHDPEWVNKYVKGQWGISNAQIHRVWPDSFLEYSSELLEKIKRKGNLFRSMDHGDSSPTCCLWFAVLGGVHICYREYYIGNQVISVHRQNIVDLSENEKYSGNYADPQIFKKTAQKQGGFWTVADEYMTKDNEGPPLFWIPADNNEFSTRNRINELLRFNKQYTHPTTGVNPAPGIYFIKRNSDYPNGCYHAISHLQSQRRKLLGYFEGKAIYTDDREEGVTDHAYDPIRYYVAMHGSGKSIEERTPPPHSFKWFKQLAKRTKGQLQPGSTVNA